MRNAFDILMNSEQHESVRYAITCGDDVEGGAPACHRGFFAHELAELCAITDTAELVRLDAELPASFRTADTGEAAVLVIRNAAKGAASRLLREQQQCTYDTHFFDATRQQTVQRHSRRSLYFAERGMPHSRDYRRRTVVALETVPELRRFLAQLPAWFGKKAAGLRVKANRYCARTGGIGFHGDAERNRVLCLSLGAPMTLRYHWRPPHSCEHRFAPIDIHLRHGDVYIMSEKATGNDWHHVERMRVVHAAGAQKFIGP